MRVYVAGSLADVAAVRDAQAVVRAAGHEVVLDWTRGEDARLRDYAAHPEVARQVAADDLRAVGEADAVVLVTTPGQGLGMYVELGAALLRAERGELRHLAVVGPGRDESVFLFHPAVERPDSLEAWLTGLPSSVTAPVLVVLSGLPGTGKTTVARELCRSLRACYLRVDAAEAALAATGVTVDVAGYAVINELAVSNLVLGATVVVDAVNPVPEARASWQEVAKRSGAVLVNVETSLPDLKEHRRRVEDRTPDIPGHAVLTWDEVRRNPWVPWDEDRDGRRVVVDTSDLASAVGEVLRAVRRAHEVGVPDRGLDSTFEHMF